MPKGGDYSRSGKGMKSGSMPQGSELKFNSTGTQGTGGTKKVEHSTKSNGSMKYGPKRAM